MTGKGSQAAREELAYMAVKAVQSVVDEDGTVDTDNITVEKKVGAELPTPCLLAEWLSIRIGFTPICQSSHRCQDRSPECRCGD